MVLMWLSFEPTMRKRQRYRCCRENKAQRVLESYNELLSRSSERKSLVSVFKQLSSKFLGEIDKRPLAWTPGAEQKWGPHPGKFAYRSLSILPLYAASSSAGNRAGGQAKEAAGPIRPFVFPPSASGCRIPSFLSIATTEQHTSAHTAHHRLYFAI